MKIDKITLSEFLALQPQPGQQTETSAFYLDIANKLLKAIADSEAGRWLHLSLNKQLALCVTGYYMDVVADGGVWRSFITACRNLYGKTLPFYDIPGDYEEFELNAVDVRFMVWYFIAMSDDTHRLLNPLDDRVDRLASELFQLLDEEYDKAPIAEDFSFIRELDFNDPADLEELYRLGSWLFLYCYLMTPAFALTMHGILSEPAMQNNPDNEAIARRFDQSMQEDTIGPLAYLMREWLKLIVEGKMPQNSQGKSEMPKSDPHPYWVKVKAAYPDKEIIYFATYEELNHFFIDVIGWEKGERHLANLSDSSNFAVMVNRDKGMLVAKDVAQCIADPENPCYDKDEARKNAFELLTIRGRCPADLLARIKENDWLPDAVWPGCDEATGRKLVAENFDFIARCYLQTYYRGD